MSSRKLIYHVAISIDGFIAAGDDSIDLFPSEGDHIPDYVESLTKYDTSILGRRTYEFGYKYGMKPGDNPYPHMNTFVYSSKLRFEKHDANLKVIRANLVQHVRLLKRKPGSSIYLCGGGVMASYLMDQGLIDEIHLKTCPIVMGSGIPMFNGLLEGVKLERLRVKSYDNGVILLHYKVMK